MRSFLWSGSDMSTTRAKMAWDQEFLDNQGARKLLLGLGKILKLRSLAWPKMKHVIGDGMTTSLWFDNWHPHSPLADTYGERFIYDSGMEHNARKLFLPPSTPKGQKDEIVLVGFAKSEFLGQSSLEQLRIHHQMVDWHDIVWFKNAVPRHAFLLWVAIQRKRAHSVSRNNEDRQPLVPLNAPFGRKHYGGMFVIDATFPRMTKSLDGWISIGHCVLAWKKFRQLFLVNWFRSYSVLYLARTVNARIFADVSKSFEFGF
ncbi:hypothetical protein NC653_018914 [Populus alba x Populus x berolinensis]|uniref:Reverse transcriptase zinc-binding domain-containing protein n=1 Tax=Populus alba x Populus x berolinensis TaxID=444605 RepID=A0AAD6VWP2_9ROSI|nr:hypothetical protein NC653_018914 [Populus alba x Populus x berolinensis]